MDTPERRKFKRLMTNLDISCYEVGSQENPHSTGRTINASRGGLYLQTSASTLKKDNIPKGTLFKVELSIPPTKGLLEFGGKLAGFAKFLRARELPEHQANDKYGVAFEFCQPPKLSV